MLVKLVCVAVFLCAACGTSVQPSDGTASTDAAITDAEAGADVEVIEPTSLVRVVRVLPTGTLGDQSEVWALLWQPETVAPGAIDRDIGDCFYRRRAPTPPRYHTDGVATWGYRSVRRQLPIRPDWPLADAVTENQPNTGDVVSVSLRESSFPDFSLSAAMPSELTVTSHVSRTPLAYPRAGEQLVVEWAVPTAPASVRIGINWNDSDSLSCIVPATRGRFVMEEPLLEMFRDATTAQLVVSHAQVQRVLAGNRALRFVVERLSVVAPFAR
jgi:hypothetical protein